MDLSPSAFAFTVFYVLPGLGRLKARRARPPGDVDGTPPGGARPPSISTGRGAVARSDVLEGVAEIIDEVVPVFQSDGQADAAGFQAALALDLVGER